jgi:methylmalonyl-CoA mutase cobalamin-binding subunit
VVLPDVLPPDWEALRHEIEDEIDDGATRLMVLGANGVGFEAHRRRLEQMTSALRAEGLEVLVVWQETPAMSWR